MKKRDNKNKVRAPEIEPASSENIIDSGDNAPQNIGITVEEEGEVPEITEQPVSLDALFTEEPEKEERKVLSDLEQIDPDLLTGEESAVRKKTPKAKKVKESKKNDVAPIKLDISGKSSPSRHPARSARA